MSNSDELPRKKKNPINIFHRPKAAWAILGISIILTVGAYHTSVNFAKHRANDQFQYRAEEVENAIKDRLKIYEELLWGVVGLYYASDDVSRKEFGKYYEALDINTNWPGIQAFGYVIPVEPKDKEKYIESVRSEGLSDFKIFPSGDRPYYAVSNYIEPFDWRNRRAFGFDVWSDEIRREAMIRARDEGGAATSGVIKLLQETEEDVQKGFVMYVPVYKSKNKPKTVEERRRQLGGWVYAAFRTGNLMKGILGTEDPNIEFEIYNGDEMKEESLLFDSNKNLHLYAVNHKPIFEKKARIVYQGRPWTLYFEAPNNITTQFDQGLPQIIVIIGIVVNIFIFYVIYSLYFVNRKAEALAVNMTKDIKKSNALLRIAREEAEKANKTKSLFLASMSHELRTPLNAIIGYSEMLMEEATESKMEDGLKDLKRIHSSGKHLLGLINDILDISKIEAGKLQLVLETFGVTQLVKDVSGTIIPLIEKNNNKLIINESVGDLEMKSDSGKIKQSLLNLLSNAAKFTKNGTIELNVTQKNISGDNWVEFSVKDTGIGIEPEQMGRLFQEFSQANERITQDFGGTGLGLVLSRRLCNLLGGDIQAQSELGKGSIFTMLLPILFSGSKRRKIDREVLPKVKKTLHSKRNLKTSTVLVIDDDPNIGDLLTRRLSKEGYEIIVARSGEEGIQLAKKNRPQIILLDILLPKMDGWDVLSQLKNDQDLCQIPVIMISTLESNKMAEKLGAADFISKPIDKDKLIKKVNKYNSQKLPPTVLVVEDDVANRDIVCRILNKSGFNTKEAENGKRALEEIKIKQPDIILLDLLMPIMDGFEFLKYLKKDKETSKIPVIVLTAMDINGEKRMGLAGSVKAIIQKQSHSQNELMKILQNKIFEYSREAKREDQKAA